MLPLTFVPEYIPPEGRPDKIIGAEPKQTVEFEAEDKVTIGKVLRVTINVSVTGKQEPDEAKTKVS